MRVYLHIALVLHEGSPRRLILYSYKANVMHMLNQDVGDYIWYYFHLWTCYWSIFVYMMIIAHDTMLYECRNYLWYIFFFAWLCVVVGLHIGIALIGLEGFACKVLVWCDDMNFFTYFVVVTLCWSCFGYMTLIYYNSY